MISNGNIPGISKHRMDTPALVVDLDILESNIAGMAAFVKGKTARLRPHYKSIKTPPIALKQVAAGAIGITCAKLGEAETLVNAGIKDILIANQIVGRQKIDWLAGLARHANMMVAVDDVHNIDELSQGMAAAGARVRVLVEVNVGNNRCGVEPGDAAVPLAHRISKSPSLIFAGLMGYEGFCMRIKDPGEKEAATRKAMEKVLTTKARVEASGLKVEIVSGGGTGTYRIVATIPWVTEIQAGTYALMDTEYRNLGIDFGCALTLMTTVLSRPNPSLAIADVGLKGITNDHGLPEVIGVPGSRLKGLSEEHAKIELTDPSIKLTPGDTIELIPSHACTTMNLHDTLYGVRKGRLEVVWPVAARGKFR